MQERILKGEDYLAPLLTPLDPKAKKLDVRIIGLAWVRLEWSET